MPTKEKEFTIPLKIENTGVKRIALGNCQGQGARSYQEDRFGFSDFSPKAVRKNGFTAIVADGMGGLSKSEFVSSTLVNAFISTAFDAESEYPIQRQLRECIAKANNAVQNSGGGSTVVAVHCSEKGIYWCSVGDSRIYLYRDRRLFQVTEDMDYRNTLFVKVLDGRLSLASAMSDKKGDALSKYVGMPQEVIAECSSRAYLPEVGDKLLLCTDGVYNALTEEELIYALELSATRSAETIHDAVIRKNYSNQDNFTSVVLEFRK